MSYLDTPRLHFAGRFQADVSTVNNDVRYFDIAGFQPKYQDFGDGGWNPVGTAIFRLVDCRITGARLGETQIVAPADDPVIGMALENADDRVFGKLVDLDPQQQMVSQIWGMRLRLASASQRAVFVGDYAPTPFTNLWRRQRGGVPMDQMLGALYQSVLQCVEWSGASGSAVLDQLREASEEDQLSIAMNVYGYARDPSIPRYTLGRVAGTIGPYLRGEPKRFVAGRQLVADAPNPTAPTNGVYSFQGKVRSDASTLTVDLGNSLQIVSADGGLFDIGTLVMAALKAETDVPLATVTADQVAILGEINYRQPDWYAQGAGIQDFDYSADPWCMQNIATRPLLLLSPQSPTSYKVMVQESLGGLYLRADDFVLRLEPGATEGVDFHATRYGAPLQAGIAFGVNMGPMGGTGGGDAPLDPPVATPAVGTPPDAISYPASLQTDPAGRVVLQVAARATGPGNPRGYIDGQLYGIGYQLAAQPPQTIMNFWNLVSILAFDLVDVPAAPEWYSDVQPIMQQYGNLYPIMSKHLVQLDDYDSVVQNLAILTLAFSLPIGDPNHMPVTRDLSDGRRAVILRWMTSPGPDGLPLKGEPVAVTAALPMQAAPEPTDLGLGPLQTKGKTAVMLAYEARMKGAAPS